MSPRVRLRVDVERIRDDEKRGYRLPFRPHMPLKDDVAHTHEVRFRAVESGTGFLSPALLLALG